MTQDPSEWLQLSSPPAIPPPTQQKKSLKGRGGVLYTSILAQSTSEKLSSKKTNTCQKWFSRFQEKKLLQGSHNLFKDAVE